MDAAANIASPNVIKALSDAGIAIATAIVFAVVFYSLISFLKAFFLSRNKSDDSRWDDFMEMWKSNMVQQETTSTAIRQFTEAVKESSLKDERQNQEIIELVNRRFGALDIGIQSLSKDLEDIKAFLMETDKAQG